MKLLIKNLKKRFLVNKKLQNIKLLLLLLIYSLNIALCEGSPSTAHDEYVLTEEMLAKHPIVQAVRPLVLEHQQGISNDDEYKPTDVEMDSNSHAYSVSSIVEWYIKPYKPIVLCKNIDSPKTFLNEDVLNSFLDSIPTPFINCSFAKSVDLDEEEKDSPKVRFISCALGNHKIIIFAAGNHNQEKTSYVPIEEQKSNIIYVGALLPESDYSKLRPALFSAIAGKVGDQFIWARGTQLIRQPYSEGTSLAAPRVTGVLSRLVGSFPNLTPQEAVKIVFLTATRSDFYSTGDQEVDLYLYGAHGALDPKRAFDFASQFIEARRNKIDLTPQQFYVASQPEKLPYQLPKTLRERLNFMAFLEESHSHEESNEEEKKVQESLERMGKDLDIGVLCSQPEEFFIPNDLYALTMLMKKSQDTACLEKLIKKTFKPEIRSAKGWTPLHHAIYYNSFILVEHYTKALPTLVNDKLNTEKVTPLLIAVWDQRPDLDIVRFLLDHDADPSIKFSMISPNLNPIEYVLINLVSLEKTNTEEKKEEQGKEVGAFKKLALLFFEHKNYESQKCFPEYTLEEFAQDIQLNTKYPDFYETIIGKQRLN